MRTRTKRQNIAVTIYSTRGPCHMNKVQVNVSKKYISMFIWLSLHISQDVTAYVQQLSDSCVEQLVLRFRTRFELGARALMIIIIIPGEMKNVESDGRNA